MTIIYGIKNCDTMKKAFHWLEHAGIDYTFVDYKKTEPDAKILKQAIQEHGWDKVINQRGTTWRKLDQTVKEAVNDENAVALALENPSIIKRPLLVKNDKTYLGFKPDDYKNIFS